MCTYTQRRRVCDQRGGQHRHTERLGCVAPHQHSAGVAVCKGGQNRREDHARCSCANASSPVLSRLQPLAKLSKNPSLRRTGIGFALFNTAEYGEWIAVLVFAYGQGGAGTTGLLAFAQLPPPCVILSPILATFADRYQPGRVLVWGYAAQALGMAMLAAALIADAPPLVVYTFAILAAPTFNVTRPTVNVLMPAAVHTPDELTAGNAALGWIENVGAVVGPLIAAVMITFGGPGAVVAVFAAGMAVSAWIALPLTRSLPPAEPDQGGSPLADAVTGFRVLARERGTAALVAVLTSQSLFFGAIDVLFVVLAIGELGIGNSGAGILNAAFGAGGLIAVFVTLGLVGRRRLAPSLIAAALIMGGSIALIAVWPQVWLTVVLLAVASIGRSLFDVSGRTLLQRTGSPAVLGRIFGVLESIDMLGLALGGLLVSVLVARGKHPGHRGRGCDHAVDHPGTAAGDPARRCPCHRADRADRPAALDGAFSARCPRPHWRESPVQWSRCMPPPARR